MGEIRLRLDEGALTRLEAEAARLGLGVEDYAAFLLGARGGGPERAAAARAIRAEQPSPAAQPSEALIRELRDA